MTAIPPGGEAGVPMAEEIGRRLAAERKQERVLSELPEIVERCRECGSTNIIHTGRHRGFCRKCNAERVEQRKK